MIKELFILFLSFVWTNNYAQTKKSDSAETFIYEICVANKAKPGHVIKNKKVGIADTIVAFVTGQVVDKDGGIPFINVSFTNSKGQVFGRTTDLDGNFKITLDSDTYSIKFYGIAYSELKIQKLKLGAGQIQEVSVFMGIAQGFTTYEVKFDHKPTEKELNAKEKELADD